MGKVVRFGDSFNRSFSSIITRILVDIDSRDGLEENVDNKM